MVSELVIEGHMLAWYMQCGPGVAFSCQRKILRGPPIAIFGATLHSPILLCIHIARGLPIVASLPQSVLQSMGIVNVYMLAFAESGNSCCKS